MSPTFCVLLRLIRFKFLHLPTSFPLSILILVIAEVEWSIRAKTAAGPAATPYCTFTFLHHGVRVEHLPPRRRCWPRHYHLLIHLALEQLLLGYNRILHLSAQLSHRGHPAGPLRTHHSPHPTSPQPSDPSPIRYHRANCPSRLLHDRARSSGGPDE